MRQGGGGTGRVVWERYCSCGFYECLDAQVESEVFGVHGCGRKVLPYPGRCCRRSRDIFCVLGQNGREVFVQQSFRFVDPSSEYIGTYFWIDPSVRENEGGVGVRKHTLSKVAQPHSLLEVHRVFGQ